MTLLNPPFEPIQAFVACFLSWFLSQLAKVVPGLVMGKRFNFRWLFDTGGMPSSHSATVACMATAVALYYGMNSMPFLVASLVSLIIMFDAASVRRNAGRQARILNKMLDEFYERGEVQEHRLKELLGHTPFEVFVGAFVGIIMAIFICR